MNRPNKTALPLAFLAVIFWSTAATAFKLAMREASPMETTVLASAVSWIILGIILLIQSVPPEKPPVKDICAALLLGLLNPVLYYWVLFAAYARLPAQIAQPLNWIWPLLIAVSGSFVDKKTISRKTLMGLLISFAGVILVSRSAGPYFRIDSSGILLALGSAFLWTLYWILGKSIRMSSLLRLFLGFTSGTVVLSVVWFIQGLSLPRESVSWFSIVWIGIFEMGITFFVWSQALKLSENPGQIGNLMYISPFLSLVWIRLFLKEPLHPLALTGLLIIIAGIAVGKKGKRI